MMKKSTNHRARPFWRSFKLSGPIAFLVVPTLLLLAQFIVVLLGLSSRYSLDPGNLAVSFVANGILFAAFVPLLRSRKVAARGAGSVGIWLLGVGIQAITATALDHRSDWLTYALITAGPGYGIAAIGAFLAFHFAS